MISVGCKTGNIPKSKVGFTEENLSTPGHHIECTPFQKELVEESICNPIAQAKLLNQSKTEFNICLGLCVGHDSLFYRYCEAPVTTLVAKDRVTGHNPVAAIYCADGYFSGRNSIDDEDK